MYISGLIRKEFGRIKSDKRTLVLIFVIPIILIIIFGLTSGGGPTEFFDCAIISKDEIGYYSYADNQTKRYSAHDDTFIDIVEDECQSWGLIDSTHVENEEEYDDAIDDYIKLLKDETIDVFLVLKEDFSETIENQTDTTLIYYIDGSDLQAMKAIEVALKEPISLFKIEIEKTENFTVMMPYLEYEVPFWEAQVLNYALPIVLSMVIVGLIMNLTTLSIVSEGPLPRMMLTPTAKNEIILSKFVANTVIMLLQVTEIFIVSAIFGMYSLGSLVNLYLVLLMTGFSGISIGLFISAFSKTEQVANQMYIMMFITLVIFSGAFVPIESLPVVMQAIIYSLPLSHAIPLIGGITYKGLPIDSFHFLGLTLIAIGYLVVAYIFFRLKKVEV
ncbi:MAG: ABC transporter permease subunit [Candidatus Lokiarchaeota archaeon]|nr:ABC transporter permease subunit [Candidatus Lokiarchaeota archaeon]MBD3338424.1 ABC transporter permease subunit [Candidatus Lokiarchaeota archaeon]